MKRCLRVVSVVLSVLLGAPLAAEAQQPGRVYRVGVLSPGSAGSLMVATITSTLREVGWLEGQNVELHARYADGNLERLPALAVELVDLRVAVLVAILNDAVVAARRATTSIPIVMAGATDPVGSGFVPSLARPGAHITGTTSNPPEVTGAKPLELLKLALPKIRRVALLFEPQYPGMPAFLQESRRAAKALDVKLELHEVRTAGDLDATLAKLRRRLPDALDVLASGVLFARRHEILAFAMKHKVPTVWPGVRLLAEEGGLMTYGFKVEEIARRSAIQVDKILRGVQPGELPVEQPTRFELVINLKTARALGLTFPQPVLLRADHVIE